jgi:hypothetical protein
MDIDAYLLEHCSPAIVEIVREADLKSPGDDDIYYPLNEEVASPLCEVAATLHIAPRMKDDLDFAVITGFLGAVASYAGLIPSEGRPLIEAAFSRLSVTNTNFLPYFAALRITGIDQKSRVIPQVTPNWTFSHPRDDDAATWHLNLYLASLGDAEALSKLENKIERTPDATAVFAFLTDLHQLPGAEVTRIIRTYADDTRRTQSVEGPGETLGTLLEPLLEKRG